MEVLSSGSARIWIENHPSEAPLIFSRVDVVRVGLLDELILWPPTVGVLLLFHLFSSQKRQIWKIQACLGCWVRLLHRG